MDPWWALWLIFTLPQILEGQTPTKPQGFPQMSNFESDKGEWFVLGLAGNAYNREHRALLNPYITLFELKNNSHFQVTNSMTRGKRCDIWSYTLIPTSKPGQFTVENKGSETDKEDMQVIETDYIKFSLVLSIRQTSSHTITRVSLLGRNWRIPRKMVDRFICLTRTQNLTKNNFVFPDVTGYPVPTLVLLSWEDSSLFTGDWSSSREVRDFGQPVCSRKVSKSPRPRGFRAEPCLQPHSSHGWIRIPSPHPVQGPSPSCPSSAYLPRHICTPKHVPTNMQTGTCSHRHIHSSCTLFILS